MKRYVFLTVAILSIVLAVAKLVSMGIIIFEATSSKEIFWYIKQLLFSAGFIYLGIYMHKLAKTNGFGA